MEGRGQKNPADLHPIAVSLGYLEPREKELKALEELKGLLGLKLEVGLKVVVGLKKKLVR